MIPSIFFTLLCIVWTGFGFGFIFLLAGLFFKPSLFFSLSLFSLRFGELDTDPCLPSDGFLFFSFTLFIHSLISCGLATREVFCTRRVGWTMHHRHYQHIASIQFPWVFAMDEVNKFKHLPPRSVLDGDIWRKEGCLRPGFGPIVR